MAIVILNGERIEVPLGETLFAVADRRPAMAQEIASSCPRIGSCGECIIEVRSGHDALSEPTPQEAFLDASAADGPSRFRLACMARIVRPDAVVEVETFKRRLAIVTDGRPVHHRNDPWITADGTAIFCDGTRIAQRTGDVLGLALDVGTTTVVLHLVDLLAGRTLARQAFENPQKYGGSDVMHRISYDASRPGQLHRSIIARVNHALRLMAADPLAVVAVAVAGNPTMRDLFFGLDVQTIGCKPFASRTQLDWQAGLRPSTAIRATGEELGLAVHPRACVYGLPLISNHVGADMAAVLMTLDAHTPDEPFMVVDIGTNTEAVIGLGERMICVSCPAGPAFEGGRLGCGMIAADGAITSLRRRDRGWRVEHLGDVPPRGICGSGLIDLLAELRTSGEMDELGRFGDSRPHVPIVESSRLVFTRKDASELAQAKGANGLGQLVLLRKLGISARQLGRYYLAGAFANHIDLDNARHIGLIPPVPDERILRLGNASIEGAKAALLSRTCRDRIEALVQRIEHVELEQEPDFFETFVDMTAFRPLPPE